MGLWQSYSSVVVTHPTKILTGGIIIVITLFFITLTINPLPSFREPLVGFEVRDTLIASRLNAWKLLTDETSASANNLSMRANSVKYDGSLASNQKFASDVALPDLSNQLPEPPIVEMSTEHGKQNGSLFEVMDEDEDEYYRTVNSTTDSASSLMHYSQGLSKAFCGKLYEGYAQAVIAPSTRYSSSGLFNLNSMIAICRLDRKLRLEQNSETSSIYRRECERFQSEEDVEKGTTTCCNSWSLPNFVACLNNKTNCMNIDSHDMKVTERLINLCAPYYIKAPFEECFSQHQQDKEPVKSTSSNRPLDATLSAMSQHDQLPRSYCGTVPEQCLRCDGWIYTVMHYLTSENFIHNRESNATKGVPLYRPEKPHRAYRESIVNKLSYTNIFLPVAKSPLLMKYYQAITELDLKTPHAQVKAMDLGLKNSLFEHLISEDIKLFLVALVSTLLIISMYTWSMILSSVILMITCLSLCLSYTIYELILHIPVFPFMNLLAIVISFGICSDNAMLFCKHWGSGASNENTNQQNPDGAANIEKDVNQNRANLDRMLKRAIISTFVATSATACSFIISVISKVIAVKCFCIFATLVVITNYLLIILLLPPALILDSHLSEWMKAFLVDEERFHGLVSMMKSIRETLLSAGSIFHEKWIFNIVTQYKFYLIITFTTLLLCSSILVYYKPTLQPSDDDIQLLSSKHPFEQYNRKLRKQFAFERFRLGESAVLSSSNYDVPDTLPVRIVFGIKPVDSGNHLDPQNRGTLTFDPNFDVTDPKAQNWLLKFCDRLRRQRFIHPSMAPDLSNCFMHTFKSWMDVRSCKDPIHTDLERSQCCQAFEFPYSSHTFSKCIVEAVNIMRKTPQFYPNLHAGVRFFKNSTKIAAIIIEYHSNIVFSESFIKMNRFFNDINEWVTMQIDNENTPPSLRSGWFISSDLELLALQTELQESTFSSILIEITFAMMALLVSTRDIVLTIAGTLTIGTIILVTVAILILLKWSLGVAESILISLSIGLSIDFALHHSVAYSEHRKRNSSDAIILSVLNEVGSPIALATVTTSLAGFVIVWSDILAYQELGVFLMLIALVSWITSTFFLLPMLSSVGFIVESAEIQTHLFLRRTLKFFLDRL